MHKCENDSIKIKGTSLMIFDGYYSDWDIYPINYCPLCGINLQPERLNPEDANSVCDSPIPENK